MGTPKVKVVVIGNKDVGKTSLLMTHESGKFPPGYIPDSLGGEVHKYMVDGRSMIVAFWDTGGEISRQLTWGLTRWRHQMDTLSALLALCTGNSPVTGEFPSQGPVTRSFDVFFDLCLNIWILTWKFLCNPGPGYRMFTKEAIEIKGVT